MSVTTYAFLLSACVLIVHYGTVSANLPCEKQGGAIIYNCEHDMYCCDSEKSGCCAVFFTDTTIAISMFIVFFVIAACMVCGWCVYRRRAMNRWSGTTFAHSVTVVPRDAQNLPQGQPGFYPPPQPEYPPKVPYGGITPPEYQPSAPNPVANPQVVPPPTVVPIGFAPEVRKAH